MTTETQWIEDKAEWQALMDHAAHIDTGSDRPDCALCVDRRSDIDLLATRTATRYYAARGVED